jgi:hypothetical protein
MTPQQIYDAVKQSIENVEADVYSLDEIFAMLSQGKKFVEDNFDVE